MSEDISNILVPIGLVDDLAQHSGSSVSVPAQLGVLQRYGLLDTFQSAGVSQAQFDEMKAFVEKAARDCKDAYEVIDVLRAALAKQEAATVPAHLALSRYDDEPTPEPVAEPQSPHPASTAATVAPPDDLSSSQGDQQSGGASEPASKTTSKPAPWTAAEEARLIEMKGQGLGWEDIAVALQRPIQAVQFRWYNKLKPVPASAPAPVPAPAPAAVADVAVEPAPSPAVISTAEDGAQAAETLPAASAIHADTPQKTSAPVPDDTPPQVHEDGGVIWHKAMSRRDIARHLDSLPPHPEWPPSRDMKLVTALMRGDGVGGASEQLGIPRDKALHRWHLLMVQVSPDNQKHLLAELTLRAVAAAPAQDAAE